MIAATWRGDISELAQRPDGPLYRTDLTVDMSIAAHEDRWPRDWFQSQG